MATATGVGFEEAAGVYFAIDDRLELHSLRALISALPNDAAFQRCMQVLADVKAGDTSDLATLSVAVREIRNLIDATAAPAREATKPVEQPVVPVSGS